MMATKEARHKNATREEFSASTRRVLASRVGWRCSNPDCRAPTTGPVEEPHRASSVGEAAHITAASVGGPRFDPHLSSKARRSPANGIWLCRNCAKSIDDDALAYPANKLRLWRQDAEELARREKGHIVGAVLQLRFADIRLDPRCAWRTTNRLRKVAEQIGAQPDIGFHEIPERAWDDLGISRRTHALEPVFDFTVVNDAQTTCVLSSVGFEVDSIWSDLKGVSGSYKVKRIGKHTLSVTKIVPGHPQMLSLPDPIAIQPLGTARISLRLQHFRQNLEGNECLLRLCVLANNEVRMSEQVYMGVY
jgi:hypothetical protein